MAGQEEDSVVRQIQKKNHPIIINQFDTNRIKHLHIKIATSKTFMVILVPPDKNPLTYPDSTISSFVM
jgi:hypothetical protein